MVNKIAAKYASAIFTGFDNVLPRSVTVGQILSDDISPHVTQSVSDVTIQKKNARIPSPSTSHSPRNDDLPTVFVMGGSQGSRKLYETFAELLQTNVAIASSFNFYITL